MPPRTGLRRRSLPAVIVLSAFAIGFHATSATAETRNPWAIDWTAPDPGPAPEPAALRQIRFDPDALSDVAQERSARLALGVVHDAARQDPATPAGQAGQEGVNARPRSFEYSHGYEVRRKIHVYASFATLPLFATEVYLGEKLYRGGFSDAERTAHRWIAGGLEGLFAVNTVTGLWNLKEGWKDPAHHRLRLMHGLLMLGSDAGFVATGMLAPNRFGENGSRTAHRGVAYLSMGVATAGYLIMLFGR
jgi:hypothetical protein